MKSLFSRIGAGIKRFWHWLTAGVLALFGIGALVVAQSASNTVTFSWTAPTAFTDGSAIPSTDAITYNVYLGSGGPGSEATTAAVTGVSAQTWAPSTTYPGGTVVCGTVRSVVNGVESANSNEACKTFPAVPNPPTGNTAK